MTDQTIDMVAKISEKIDALGVKIGIASEHLWDVLTRQAFISSVSELTCFLTAFLVLGIGIAVSNRKLKGEDRENFPVFILSLVASLVFIVFLSEMNGIVTGFINPEYTALKEILRAL